MSSLIVEVSAIRKIEPHPNADLLEIAVIKGWRVVVKKDTHQEGDLVVYFPPDTTLSQTWTNHFGITKYCSPWKGHTDGSGTPLYRIRATRLRGEASYGTVVFPFDSNWSEGTDVASFYGAIKWEPPVKSCAGEAATDHPGFTLYTDIENINNFPEAFVDGEEVIFTEKIHGSCCRMGLINVEVQDEEDVQGRLFDRKYMAGSHNVRRREFDKNGNRSTYWEGMTDGMRDMLVSISDTNWEGSGNPYPMVMVYGELYGSSVQDMTYGHKNGKKSVRVFDISVNGVYMDFDEVVRLCGEFGVITVPVLYRGPYSRKILDTYTDGPTTLCSAEEAGNFAGREGIVVKPKKEGSYNKDGRPSRKILKSISVDYLARKNPTEFH